MEGLCRFSAAVLMQPGPLNKAVHVIPLPADRCIVMLVV